MRSNIQAGCVVLQYRLLQVGRDHAIGPAHVDWSHLTRHQGLLPQELILLLFSETHHVLCEICKSDLTCVGEYNSELTNLIVLEILPNFVAVAPLALGPEKIPEETEPVQ